MDGGGLTTRHGIVEGEPGIFPDPFARLFAGLSRWARRRSVPTPPQTAPIGGAVHFDHVDDTQGDPPEELAEHFQGDARIQRFPNPFPADGPAVFAVHFRAGGRTKPHVHRNGQVLHVSGGRGIIGTRAGRRTVEAGDVVIVMPDEWHWHGASPDSPMTHVTVQVAGPDSIDWDVDEGDWADDYEA